MKLKIHQLTLGDLAQVDRHWDKIGRCWCSTPSGGKLFAINLPSTAKQYKVDNIAKFVYCGKTRPTDIFCKPMMLQFFESSQNNV